MGKLKLILFTMFILYLCVDIGIVKTTIVVISIIAVMILILLPLWLMAFVMYAVITHDLKETWSELKPSKVLYECFFSSNNIEE